MDAGEIARLLAKYRFFFCNETELQDRLQVALLRNGIGHEREFRLSAKDRPDFLACGEIVIEVKIKGSRTEVMRQLARYASFDQVKAIVLVTTKANHLTMPQTLNGKPIHVASLLSGAF